MTKRDKLKERFRLGSASLGFLILALTLGILLIAGADMVERKYALKIDYSFNGITSQGRETDSVLKSLNKEVHAYALFSPGQEDKALIGLLDRYAAKSSLFTFSLENLALNPALTDSISSSLRDNEVTSDSLILYCRETDRTRVLDGSLYISQGYDPQSESLYIAGFNYEKALTEALIYVSADRLPQIQLLSGHGELNQADIQDMAALLNDYNYMLQDVDLLRGDELNPEYPLMILSPKKDLTAPELSRLDAFTRDGGALFITEDFSSAQALPNFSALYRGFGFEKRPGLVVAEATDRDSYYDSPAVLIPDMEITEATAALAAADQTSLLLAGSAAFAQPQSNSVLSVQVVLKSGEAYLRSVSDAFGGIEKQPGDEEGAFPLALLADRIYEDGTHSRAFIIGNSSLFTDSWLQQNTFSAEFLLNIIDHLDPGEAIDLPISPKDAVRPPLDTSSPLLTGIILALLPLTVLAASVFVLLPRKRM